MSNATFPVRQSKFSNGEVSELLYGDTKHPKYDSSLKICLNILPVPQGALVKRSGTQFVAPFKHVDYPARLIPFVFSDGQAFVLEVGRFYIRVYKNKQYVGADLALHTYGDGYAGGWYEIPTVYTESMLPYLKHTQVGDVITFTYGGQAAGNAATPPYDLFRATGTVGPWTFRLTPTKIPVTSVPASPTVNIQAWDGRVYKAGDFASQNNVLWISIQSNNSGNSPPVPALNSSGTAIAGTLYWMPAVDLAHPAVTVNWATTSVVQDPNGITYETGPSPALTGTGPLGLDRQVPLVINPGSAGLTPALPAGWTLLYHKMYRAPQNGIYGWLADVQAGVNVVWLDEGWPPDYTKQPPKGTDPFLVGAADSYPCIIGYLDQRRLWAASSLMPNTVMLSKVGDLYNYDNKNSPGADTDAVNFLLVSEVLEQARSFVPLKRGLLFTGQGEWTITGLGGGPVSRSSVDPKRQSTWGSSWLNPIKIGTGVIFNTAKSNMVRDLYPLYGTYTDIWDGQDLTVMSRHMFDLHTLSDWAFQSVPYPLVWSVREDGTLLSLTYQHAPPSFGQTLTDGTVAWARHTTGVGYDTFESVCAVPEPPEDAVYVGVKRLVGGLYARSIERFTSLICPASPYKAGCDVRYGRYLDACVSWDGHNDKIGYSGTAASIDSYTNPGSVLAADYAIGSQITINIVGGPFIAADASSAFVFDPEGTLGLGPVKAHMLAYVSGAQVIAELDTPCTDGQIVNLRAGITNWGLAKGSITAAHLTDYQIDSGDANLLRGIIALTDGDVQSLASWVGGVASFATPAVMIQLGISYNSDVGLLDAYTPTAEIRNKFKNVVRVGFEVSGTRDLWVGKDFDTLTQWEQRSVADAYDLMKLASGYYEEMVYGEFGKSGQAVVRHFQPLPLILTALLREMVLGDS